MIAVDKIVSSEPDINHSPENWSATRLGNISSIRKTKGAATNGIKCIELEHIESETGRIIGWDDTGTQASIKTAFLKNDVLFGKLRPYLRKFAIAPFNGICTTEILAIYPIEGQTIKGFLFYVIQSDIIFDVVNSISFGTKMPRVSWSDLSEIVVPIPPLNEQQKIAEILTAVDDKLELITRQIAATQTLKQGLMRTLFSRGVGTQDVNGRWLPHTEFKDSELGKIPVSWQGLSLEKFCDGVLKTGPFGSQLHASEYQDEGVSVVMPKDLINYRVDKKRAAKITPERAEILAKHKLEKGDILFSRRGDVARFALIDEASEGSICGTGCLKAKPSKEHSSAYLSHLLQLDSVKEWLEQNAVGQTMPNMNTSILASLPLIAPPSLAEEEEIAGILDCLDKKLNILVTKQTHHQTLKRGLMQKLLTGEWRVKVEEPNSEDI